MPDDSTSKSSEQINSIFRANAKLNKATAWGGGNLGDSVERRVPYGSDYLGGGNDFFNGFMGAATSFSSLGPGMYFGPGYGDWSYGRGAGPYGMGQAGPFTYLNRFSGNAAMVHRIIAGCQLAYLTYGIIKNIIDLYADFASEGLEIVHENESTQHFYETWARRVDIQGRANRFLTDYFLTGNVFIYRVNAKLSDEDTRSMKRSKSYQIIDGEIILDSPRKLKPHVVRPRIEIDPMLLAIPELKSIIDKTISSTDGRMVTAIVKEKPPSEFDIPENKDKLIPWDYISLNPLQMEPRGKKFKGDRSWAFALDRSDTAEISEFLDYRYNLDLGRTQVNLPDEFKYKLTKYEGPTTGYVSEIRLDKQRLSLLQDKKFDYWDWSIPLVWPALKAVAFKEILINMDIRVATSMINTVTLWKLGDPKNNTYPEPEAIEKLADMLQQPGQAVNLIWNKDIEAEVIQANITGLFDEAKYEAANRDIIQALGIAEVLVGGKGANFSNSYISVATVLEKLKSARNNFEHWLMRELKIIADAMGFRSLPKIRWAKSSLTDQKTEQTLIIQLFDRNIISAETALKYFDEDLQIEVERQIREKKISQQEGQGVLEKRGPYLLPENIQKVGVTPINWEDEEIASPAPPAPPGDPPKPGTDKGKISKGPISNNGRPPGSIDKTKRKTKEVKPRGKSSLSTMIEYARLNEKAYNMIGKLEEIFTSKLLKTRGLNYYKQLTTEDKQSIESLVIVTLSNLNPEFNITSQTIADLMQTKAPLKLERCVKNVYSQRIAKFKSDNGRSPNKDERKKILSSSYAICKTSTGLN